MSKVITFSRTFIGNHTRKGEPTWFVEKVFAGLAETMFGEFKIPEHFIDWDWHEYYNGIPKYHTIRAGHRFKVNDWFSPRIWSGRPYNSKQITIGPDLQVKKVWDFDIEPLAGDFLLSGHPVKIEQLREIAMNDGFDNLDDFESWFPREFRGQIICWNEEIDYSLKAIESIR